VVFFFPEMHQDSPMAITDFKNFPGKETPDPRFGYFTGPSKVWLQFYN